MNWSEMKGEKKLSYKTSARIETTPLSTETYFKAVKYEVKVYRFNTANMCT